MGHSIDSGNICLKLIQTAICGNVDQVSMFKFNPGHFNYLKAYFYFSRNHNIKCSQMKATTTLLSQTRLYMMSVWNV